MYGLPSSVGLLSSIWIIDEPVAAPQIPINFGPPSISGSLISGQILTAVEGFWFDPLGDSISFSYQWYRDGVVIVGATSSTYLLVDADVATEIHVLETATNSDGSASEPSNSTAAIAPLVITNPIVGDPAGQKPFVHVWDSTADYDLYTLDADTQSEFPASCVKLMTALLAWEYLEASWSSNITVVASDCGQPLPGLTLDMVGFAAGDIVTTAQVVSSIMLASACDGCQIIARVVGALILGGSPTEAQSRTAFVARMNSRAVELGIQGTFFDSYGGSKTFGPDTVRNVLSARDLTILCYNTFLNNPTLRTIASTASNPIVIAAGPSPRTLSNANYSPFINGPYHNRAGAKDSRVVAGKDGVWVLGGFYNHNHTLIWTAPNGNEIVITTIQSKSAWGMVLDQKGLMYSILRDFPYLWDSGDIGTDAAWANVKLLVGADGSITDESSFAHTATVTSVTLGDPVIATDGGMVFNTGTDEVAFADAATLHTGSSDMCIELWYAGPGAAPGTEYVFFAKYNTNQVEFALDYNGGMIQMFGSANGSAVTSGTAVTLDPFEYNVFFNGAPRHIALVKSGGDIRAYLNGERMANPMSIATLFNGSAPVTIGLPVFSVTALGRVDDFRFTIGSSRMTSAMETILALPFARG
jgi:hypothetical protein